MYIPRTLEAFLQAASQQFPVLLITGPRQVGKTTILQHLNKEGRYYVTLDDPMMLEFAKEEPGLFFQRFPPPILIDEIQYAPQLLSYIKMQVDQQKKPGAFWLTGSQKFHLMKGISETLAGRVGIVNLLGFTLREMQGRGLSSPPFLPTPQILEERINTANRLSLQEIYQVIWRGAFPAIALNASMDRDLFYGSYVQTYLQRDVRHLTKVGDEAAFFKFLRAAAARTGQMLNMSDLARDVGISPATAHQWLSILETSGIIYLLEPYHSNLTKRLIKTPKLYFLDTGLSCYLTGWSNAETLEAGAMSGAILETFILTEILKSYWHNGKFAPPYYYRDKDKKEIDLLMVQDDTLYPLEFKKTAAPNKWMIQDFKVLERLNKPIGQGGVVCLADMLLPMGQGVSVIPVYAL